MLVGMVNAIYSRKSPNNMDATNRDSSSLLAGYPLVLTPEDVSRILRIKTTTVHELCRKGKLPGFKVGSFWRFTKSSIEAIIYASEHCVQFSYEQ